MEYITKGIILRVKNFKDEDKIYSIFSYERGLINAIGKSVSSTKSKLSGFLIPGNVCTFMLAQGKALDKLAQVTVIDSYNISENYNIFLVFNRMSEILLHFLPEYQQEKYIYEQSINFLKDINSDLYDLKDLEICYYLSIIREFGFNIKINTVLKKEELDMIGLFIGNTYLKNRELVLKLIYDKHAIFNYIKIYFENTLEKKLNSF